MIAKVYGIQNVDFTTKDGKQIKGTKLYVGYKTDYVQGVKCDDVFLGSAFDMRNIKLGATVSFDTDFNGKVIGVNPINTNE